MYTQELARARQQEISRNAQRRIWHSELRLYRRTDGRMHVLRLRRR